MFRLSKLIAVLSFLFFFDVAYSNDMYGLRNIFDNDIELSAKLNFLEALKNSTTPLEKGDLDILCVILKNKNIDAGIKNLVLQVLLRKDIKELPVFFGSVLLTDFIRKTVLSMNNLDDIFVPLKLVIKISPEKYWLKHRILMEPFNFERQLFNPELLTDYEESLLDYFSQLNTTNSSKIMKYVLTIFYQSENLELKEKCLDIMIQFNAKDTLSKVSSDPSIDSKLRQKAQTGLLLLEEGVQCHHIFSK